MRVIQAERLIIELNMNRKSRVVQMNPEATAKYQESKKH